MLLLLGWAGRPVDRSSSVTAAITIEKQRERSSGSTSESWDGMMMIALNYHHPTTTTTASVRTASAPLLFFGTATTQ